MFFKKLPLQHLLPKYLVQDELCLLLLGLKGAGKTTMLKNLKLADIQLLKPVEGFHIKTVKYDNITFISWNVGRDQYIYRQLWKYFYKNTRLIIFVVDASNLKRIEETKEELSFIMKKKELENVPILILANKSDNVDVMSTGKLIDVLHLDKYDDRHWLLRTCTTKDGDVLYDALEDIMSSLDQGDNK